MLFVIAFKYLIVATGNCRSDSRLNAVSVCANIFLSVGSDDGMNEYDDLATVKPELSLLMLLRLNSVPCLVYSFVGILIGLFTLMPALDTGEFREPLFSDGSINRA